MARAHSFGELLDGLPVGDVADLRLAANLVRHRSQPLLAARDEDAVPAAAGERAGHLCADSARAAGDDGDA
jgi:hypothetical protein